MSIVHALVQAHHGTVALDTAPGRGLTVLVTLPAARAGGKGTVKGTAKGAAKGRGLPGLPVGA